MRMTEVKSLLEIAVTINSCRNHIMYSSVGTQTPTEDRSFEFPDCFSPSPPMSRSPVSSIGTQTDARRRISGEAPDNASSQYRPKLFRRHSTGSDVYNFSSSPTLITAFGGIPFGNKGLLSRRILPAHSTRNWKVSTVTASPDESGDDCDEVEGVSVGEQLRKIADDLDERGKTLRSRSLSVSRFLGNIRRRTSSSSS
ncbi:hypothetical protein Ocin01_02349 [Orchesella cincta]|uniref:Uncharacterized protein n=1 Tax=Orchesella cincta TaxID=48709 RepID=A0A1D2NGE2_ORCCI|nr:hypothetical protein Ocin01_02349 [Orchesella cincta]